VRSEVSNGRAIPGKRRNPDRWYDHTKVRKFRSFLADSVDGTLLVSRQGVVVAVRRAVRAQVRQDAGRDQGLLCPREAVEQLGFRRSSALAQFARSM
jgi:hypothetical protein